VYDSSFSLRDEFDGAESEARANDVGLWNFDDESSSSDADESASASGDEIYVPPTPADGDYDRSHFETQEQAQYVLEDTAGDPMDLTRMMTVSLAKHRRSVKQEFQFLAFVRWWCFGHGMAHPTSVWDTLTSFRPDPALAVTDRSVGWWPS
jgi:hypothetical protein